MSFIKFLFTILSLSLFLYGADLDKIETNLKSGDETAIRAYNSLKSAYINALINKDEEELKDSLKLLSKYASEFGEDSGKYAKELNKLTLKPPEEPKIESIKEPSPPAVPKIDKPIAKKPEPPKAVVSKDRDDTKKKNLSNRTPKITSVSSKDGSLEIVFDSTIDESILLKEFELKGSPLKQVYDIKGDLFSKNKNPKVTGFKKVVVAQNRDGVTRVVFYTDRKQDIQQEISDNKLTLFTSKKPIEPPPKKAKPKPNPLANKVVVLDPGHGGKDCGAVAYDKTCEKDIALKIAKYTRDYLRDLGVKRVYLTRSTDKFIKLRERTKFANDNNADIFVSIHLNSVAKSKAHKLKGVETYFLSHARSDRAKNVAAIENKDAVEDMDYFTKNTFLSILNSKRIVDSNKLSIDIQRGMINQLDSDGIKDGGVREGPFWVLVGAQMPSVLVEGGYISNKDELKLLKKVSYQKKLAKGIAIGIVNYLKRN